MTAEHQAQELPVVDEGSWAYLIGPEKDRDDADPLWERVAATCEASGWPAVSWSPVEAEHHADPGHFFEGVRHAVEHADFVVALLGVTVGRVDAELAIAYGYRCPIVGIRLSGEGTSVSEIQAMLEGYERARVIACDDVDGCAAELRDVLSDPDFAATIHTAAGEHAGDV